MVLQRDTSSWNPFPESSPPGSYNPQGSLADGLTREQGVCGVDSPGELPGGVKLEKETRYPGHPGRWTPLGCWGRQGKCKGRGGATPDLEAADQSEAEDQVPPSPHAHWLLIRCLCVLCDLEQIMTLQCAQPSL